MVGKAVACRSSVLNTSFGGMVRSDELCHLLSLSLACRTMKVESGFAHRRWPGAFNVAGMREPAGVRTVAKGLCHPCHLQFQTTRQPQCVVDSSSEPSTKSPSQLQQAVRSTSTQTIKPRHLRALPYRAHVSRKVLTTSHRWPVRIYGHNALFYNCLLFHASNPLRNATESWCNTKPCHSPTRTKKSTGAMRSLGISCSHPMSAED